MSTSQLIDSQSETLSTHNNVKLLTNNGFSEKQAAILANEKVTCFAMM